MKEYDDYILRCIDERKIIVDCENGVIFSVYAQRNFKPMTKDAGYKYLDFKFFGERRSVSVHRIVYLARHRDIPEDCVIDHIDRDRSNNRISNLRAVTQMENMKNRGD